MSIAASNLAAAPEALSPGLASMNERFDWQKALFAPAPERARLLALHADWPLTPRRLRFHRNHAIESTLTVLRPYLEYAGIAPEFVVSDYDDSLTFSTDGPADVEVIWLDYARFSVSLGPAKVASWLSGRVAALRKRTSAPVLILDWDAATDGRSEFAQTLRESVRAVGGVHICDRRELFEELGDRYFDHERVSMTGTRVSRQGAVHTARQLSGWLTAVLEPRLKAVVVDLDNTLYRGVIGEDGIHAVLLTEAHAELQRTLLSLRESGVFLGVVSRNEPADVRELFSTRPDFPLSWDDFSAHSIGWQPKSEGIIAVAKALRIDVGAILFVDDNVGELLEAAQRVPWIRCVHAEWEADRTAAALRYFPSLSMLEGGAEDGLRIADLRANDERERVLESAGEDLESYYRELGVRLTVDPRPSEAIGRVAELSRKTNQFNLAMQRYSEADLQRRLETGQWELATVRLEDRLTDSGVIATAVVERRGQTLVVHELCISCRALGRRLEDLIVAQLITHGALSQDVNEVVFRFVDGPRNRPARTWLSNFVGRPIPVAPDLTDVAVPADRVAEASVNPYISIQVNS